MSVSAACHKAATMHERPLQTPAGPCHDQMDIVGRESGWIVVGSLIAGLAAAVFLAFAPFVTADENTFTGMVKPLRSRGLQPLVTAHGPVLASEGLPPPQGTRPRLTLHV